MIKIKRKIDLGINKPMGLVLIIDTGTDLEDAEIACNFMWGKDFVFYKIFKNDREFIPNQYEIGSMIEKLSRFNNQ